MLPLEAAGGPRDSRRFGSVEHRARSTKRNARAVVTEVPGRPEVRAEHGTGKDAAALSVAPSVAVRPVGSPMTYPEAEHRRERWTISSRALRGCATLLIILE